MKKQYKIFILTTIIFYCLFCLFFTFTTGNTNDIYFFLLIITICIVAVVKISKNENKNSSNYSEPSKKYNELIKINQLKYKLRKCSTNELQERLYYINEIYDSAIASKTLSKNIDNIIDEIVNEKILYKNTLENTKSLYDELKYCSKRFPKLKHFLKPNMLKIENILEETK